ncbi:hypothetical protein [Bradyrhizobium sp.]|jgi:hypothetical protein
MFDTLVAPTPTDLTAESARFVMRFTNLIEARFGRPLDPLIL